MWRYRPTGKTRHVLITPDSSHAACGVYTRGEEKWLGTGGDEEYKRLLSLPRCRRCVRRYVEAM